jgi:hypothetical protein
LLLLLLGLTLPPAAPAASDPSPEQAVQMLNEWRGRVGLMPVSHDLEQTEGCRAHFEYYRQTGQTGHYEDPSQPGYTEAGAKAAASSVLAYGSGDLSPYVWEDAVYHRTGLLDPRLATTGFWAEHGISCMGVFGDDQGRTVPGLTVHPYPYNGQVDVATTFSCNERPNPCLSVPGNDGEQPTGFIPSVQFNGPWSSVRGPEVSVASLTPDGGAPLAITVEDLDSGLGEYLDGGFDLIPHQPLAEGTWYTASAAGVLQVFAEEGEEAVPFSTTWRFQTKAPRQVSGSHDPGLRVDFFQGRPRVSSQSPAPVRVLVTRGSSTSRLALSLVASGALYTAIVPVTVNSAWWQVCATQAGDPAGSWRADRTCLRGSPIRLRPVVLRAAPSFLRVRIASPPAAHGRPAIVSLRSRRGAVLDRARVVLRRKTRLTLRGPRGVRAKLRVSVRPFRRNGIPQRVIPVSKNVP